MADNLEQLYGDYSPEIDATFTKTPLESLSEMSDTVNYIAGCMDNKCTEYDAVAVRQAVTGTQLVIVCVGTGTVMYSLQVLLSLV